MNNDLISRSALKKDLLDRSFFPAIVKAALEKAPAVDAVVIPCKIGDTVWAIRRYYGHDVRAVQGTVSEMQFLGSEMALSITVKGFCRGEWGKTIFATREEAEAEISRKRG